MIKLQDFAKQQGVTDRAIQKHLKTYATELEGLFERKGPNGTWLSEEACEILRSKMKQQPLSFPTRDEADMRRIQDLEEEISYLRKQNYKQVEAVKALAEANASLSAQIIDFKRLEGENTKRVEIAEKTAEKAVSERDILVNGSWRERRKLRRELKRRTYSQDEVEQIIGKE